MTVTVPSVFIEDVPTPTLVRDFAALKADTVRADFKFTYAHHARLGVVVNELRRRGVLDGDVGDAPE